MTKQDLIALIDENGGDEYLNGLMFDNSMNTIFNSDRPFNRDMMLVTIGGVDYFKLNTKIRNKSGIYDIDMVHYHPLDCLQALDFVTNPKDQDKIDIWELGDIH